MARQRFSFKIPEAGERTWEWRAIKSVAMATLFIALQCCNCSTMQVGGTHLFFSPLPVRACNVVKLQVKQQRKGTISKWVCAVCNQRQSVRRIHARGPLARDLREFVQDFNMARAAAEADLGNPNPPLSRAEDDPFSVSKRRTDWSEYLDLEADLDGIEQDASPEPAVVVTQLPLAKSATKRSSCFKSPVEKRKKTPIGVSGKAVAMDEKRGCGSSKWSEYLDCEEEEEGEAMKGAKWCDHEEAVEEEVRPDFK
ncbi:uncharacterized protein LOC122054110 isoform X2 [Zingiber officinale]|uniref:uncharacterized protein LOC122054110 isoform X2 n=1 Tax=Zingiber officinale TaxID=94328 RepID=UPI001C4D31BF|nr:uncharacterized protein LOC122054110 isoform X2 [Zingiber officinale]